jgi:hypothetical protein
MQHVLIVAFKGLIIQCILEFPKLLIYTRAFPKVTWAWNLVRIISKSSKAFISGKSLRHRSTFEIPGSYMQERHEVVSQYLLSPQRSALIPTLEFESLEL